MFSLLRVTSKFTWGILCFFAVILVVVFVGTHWFTPKGVSINDRRVAVVKEIQLLGNLETASFTLEKVIEAGTDKEGAFRDFLYGDRILLIAHGTVVAGFDLSTLKSDDVTVEGDVLRVRIGAPKIFSSTLDSSRTTVYDRTVGLLKRSGDKNLEAQARKSAELSLLQNACDEGILTIASQRGKEILEKLFGFAGFSHVVVEVENGKCYYSSV